MNYYSNAAFRTNHKLLAKSKAVAIGVLASMVCSPLFAGIAVPTTPLQSGTVVAPNIMIILDDSGSMQGEIMPDGLFENLRWRNNTDLGNNNTVPSIGLLFPRATTIYGNPQTGSNGNNIDGQERASIVATANVNSAYGRMVRSFAINKIYYNPAITYAPWSNQDGSLFAPASITCAPHNPMLPAQGCRNLTVTNSNALDGAGNNYTNWMDRNPARCGNGVGEACDGYTNTINFWPATYYIYNGGTQLNVNSYAPTEIISTTTTYSNQGRLGRTDCGTPADGTCSYAEEIQNFANWYTYYRSRTLLARAGIGAAFSGLPLSTAERPAARVGFGTINTGNNANLDGQSSPGTIVRGVRSFDGVNRTNFFNSIYTSRVPMNGTPLRSALDEAGKYYERTDDRGPWGATPGTSSGTPPIAQLACRQSYSILTTDGYWNGDAATGNAQLDTESTAATVINPAGVTVNSYTPANPFTDGRANKLSDVAMYYWKRDLRTDLANKVPVTSDNPAFWQHMITIGVGLGVEGTISPATAFSAVSTATAVAWPDPDASNPAKIDDLLHAAVNSRGDFFTANDPVAFKNGLTGVLNSISDKVSSGSSVSTNSTTLDAGSRVFLANYAPAKWSGEFRAFAVTAAGVSNTVEWSASPLIPAQASRKIFTRGATGGALFQYANLTPANQTAVGNAAVVNYLRGDRTNEGNAATNYRVRDHLLGDIINSSPVFVPPPTTTAPGVAYVGANDGMLHAFNAQTGVELFAYVPAIINWSNLASLADKNYSHKYFVDGQIAVSRLDQTPGKNLLVGALGRGGKGVYSLDVSTPSSFSTGDVEWEYAGDADMGQVLATPLIAKVNTGATVAIVSNGINSTNDDAALYIIDLTTGALVRKLYTGDTNNNGLSTPRTFDSDSDGDIDYVFAGDYQGNVWRFDLTSNNAALWTYSRLFTATDASGNRQPISGGITLGRDSALNLWVFFGTGRYLTATDPNNNSVQTWYGIQDSATAITGRAALKQRSIIITTNLGGPGGPKVRAFENAVAGDMAGKSGWFIDLVEPPNPPGTAAGERMIGTPVLRTSSVLVALSVTPNLDVCEAGGSSFVNAIDPYTGGNVTSGFFDANNDGTFTDQVTVGGIPYYVGSYALDLGIASGSVFVGNNFIGSGSATTPVTSIDPVTGAATTFAGPLTISLPTAGNPRLGRVTWREILTN
jgi:type IV pilus assembly protein PilY1